MKKVISFSIWGNKQLYTKGIVSNIEMADTLFPDWVCRIYHDERVPASTIGRIKELGAETQIMKATSDWGGLFWRFIPAGDDSVDVTIIRDADSRISVREKACVDEWLSSDKCFHGMRDHYEHNVPIMGGMWGAKKGCIPFFKELLKEWSAKSSKGDDQTFLSQIVWPMVKDKAIIHDRYYNGMIMSNKTIIPWEEVDSYNNDENCGHKNSDLFDTNFPHGKVVLKDGTVFNRDLIYEYRPLDFFGKHDIRPFPDHPPMEYGSYVGEIIKE